VNIVCTGSGRFVEVQGTGEEETFSREQLDAMIALAQKGIQRLVEHQNAALADASGT
jgi:ribonuclease PH